MRSLGCRFVPPYLLVEIARRGGMDPGQAAACLQADGAFRERRTALSESGLLVAPPAAEPAGAARWTVHDADHAEVLPGEPVRREGEPASGDAAVDEAAAGLTATLDLFRDVYGRDSYDGAGAAVLATVHYGRSYANAFWDGAHLVFGDGDGRVFGRFTRAVDVLAHEFAHAVTQHTADLRYRGQSGALNESVSDVFAACLEQRLRGQTAAEGDWLIGSEIFVAGVSARGLRDMESPGTAYDDPQLGRDPQPAHMRDFVDTTDDNGGVHINSGIPNRAFVLAARAVGGTAAEGAGRIWYAALTTGGLGRDADFATFAAATVAAAGDDAAAVEEAWLSVGVTPGAVAAPGPAPAPVPADRVVVRRSGGVTGQVVEGAVDLEAGDPRADELRDLLGRVDLRAVAATEPQPDRFVYVVRVGSADPVEVPESALTGDLRRLVGLVLDR